MATYDDIEPSITTDTDRVETPEDNHVFIVTGLPGAGKSTAIEYIVSELKRNFEQAIGVEVSDFVRGMFEHAYGETVNDNELGRWAAEQKRQHGNGYFVRELAKAIDSDDNRPHVAISGVRSPKEALAAKDVFGPDTVTVVALWTLPDVRFERKYGSVPSTDHPKWDEFVERNERETHEWNCVEFYTDDGPSDYIIPNNSTIEDLEMRLRRIIAYEGLGYDRRPTDLEDTPFPVGLDRERIAQYL